MKNIFKIAIGVGIVIATAGTGLLIKRFVDHNEVEEEDESPIEEAVANEMNLDLLDDLRSAHERIMLDLEEKVEDENQELHDELEKVRQENLADIERIAKTYDPLERMKIMHYIYERCKIFKEELGEDTPNE